MIAKVNLSVLIARREENTPPVFGHAHISEVRPTIAIYADGRSEVDLQSGCIRRPCFVPPVQERRLPVFERALQVSIVREIDVVGNALGVIDCLLT